MTLYDLNVQFCTLLELAEDGDIDPQVIANTLEGLECEIEWKLDSYGVVVNELLTDIAKIDTEIKRLTEKKRRINTNIDRIKEKIYSTMLIMDKKKIAGERFTWQIQKNGGKAPLIINEGVLPLDVPEDFQHIDVDFDRVEIRKALEQGKVLDFAHLGERGESLRLK